MSLLSRLREALLPEYEVEREIASGGMGTVFLARETALDRPVAIKLLRPELATARAVERFLREARTLARLAHPNIVPVHHVGEAGGFYFYVMEYMPGETLAQRLRRGPLGVDEVRQLGRDILDALEIAHRNDVVHRDVKPQNIFLAEGRFVLGDFGIASTSNRTPTDEGDDAIRGTPQYMPPEQRYGWEVGPRTDLYGVGLVLYEALTGRRWEWFLPGERPDWSQVPRTSGTRRLLRQALAFRPGDRWPDAHTFRHALWRTRVRKYVARTVALTAGGLLVGWLIGILKPSGIPLADLVITEFQVPSPGNINDGIGLAYDVQKNLVAYRNRAAADRRGPGPLNALSGAVEPPPVGADAANALGDLHTRAYISGVVIGVGNDSIEAHLTLVREGRSPSDLPVASGTDQGSMACHLGREIVRLLALPAEPYECLGADTAIPVRANRLSTEGELAFRRQAWHDAEALYAEALTIDPSFAEARWGLLNAQRWIRDSTPESQRRDLERLYAQQGQDLLAMDRHLLEAWLTPFGPARFAKYQDAIDDLPRNPYTWLVYGDDLFARGALAGITLDSARVVLERAVTYDSTMGPALMDLAWMATRRGDSVAAREAVTRLLTIAEPDAGPIPQQLFDLAVHLRFGTPEQRSAALAQLLTPGSGTDNLETFLTVFRWGLSFDLAPAQLRIADTLLHDPRLGAARMILLEARGLALTATGRHLAALADFDQVAAVVPLPEARLQAAQWRVLPSALHLELVAVPDAVVDSGLAVLESLATDPAVADRADWTLAVYAYARGNVAEARRRAGTIQARGDSASTDLVAFLSALQRAAMGDVTGALDATDPLVPYVSSERGSEPFLRSALYLMRATWKRRLDPHAVPPEWTWHLNFDLRGWPVGLAQAGEIDWVFGTYARLVRARALLGASRGWIARALLGTRERREACRELARVAELWTEADVVYAALEQEALTLRAERCR